MEQAALAAALLLLARRLAVADFGAVSLVFAYYSLAVTVSDYGLGLALLRTAPGTPVERHALNRCRTRNLALGLSMVLVGTGLAIAHEPRTAILVVAAGALWGTSAEAYVRKAASLRLNEARRVAVSEVGASLVLLLVVLIGAHGSNAAAVVAVAFVLKSMIELLAQPTAVSRSFADHGENPAPGLVWASQVLSFATANVDYVVVQILLGPRALGLYSLSFRIAGLIPSQVSFVVSRVSTVHLAQLTTEERSHYARRLIRALFLGGVVVTVVGVLVAPFVGDVFGRKWDDAAPVIALLVAGAPWRLILPVTGIVALVRDRAGELCVYEGARLALVVVMLVVGAQLGLVWCAALGTSALMLGSTAGHLHPRLRSTDPAAGWLAGLCALSVTAVLVGAGLAS